MAAWLAPVLGLAGGLFGNRSNRRQAAATNAANVEMTRETNEANRLQTEATNATNLKIAQELNEATRENQRWAFEQGVAHEGQVFERGVAHEQAIWDRGMQAEQEKFVNLRDAATAAGFNPLSVLGLGFNAPGGAVVGGTALQPNAVNFVPGFAENPPPGQVPNRVTAFTSPEAWAQGFSDFGKAMSGQDKLQEELIRSEINLNNAMAEERRTGIGNYVHSSPQRLRTPQSADTAGAKTLWPNEGGSSVRSGPDPTTSPELGFGQDMIASEARPLLNRAFIGGWGFHRVGEGEFDEFVGNAIQALPQAIFDGFKASVGAPIGATPESDAFNWKVVENFGTIGGAFVRTFVPALGMQHQINH